MIHQSEAQLRQVVIGPLAAAKHAWLHIALTFPRAEKNVSAPAFFNHPHGNVVVLVFVTVCHQLRAVVVPLEASPHLIAAVSQIGIVGQIVAAAVFDGADALDLRLDGIHNPHVQDAPHKSRLPVY